MQAMGVLLAHWHDVGMVDYSPFGRKMHPERACQLIFALEMDEWGEQVWQADCGRVATHLSALAQQGFLAVPPQVMLREILALAMGHSKSKVPVLIIPRSVYFKQWHATHTLASFQRRLQTN
ncbi:MAG: hypothetical protein V9G20_00040 [Candidatus Promineifilaceae bacterium]|nr:hypothetical protein [Chloroflexota bacterium]